MNTATRDHPAGDLRVCDADRDRALRELSQTPSATPPPTTTIANSPSKSWRGWA